MNNIFKIIISLAFFTVAALQTYAFFVLASFSSGGLFVWHNGWIGVIILIIGGIIPLLSLESKNPKLIYEDNLVEYNNKVYKVSKLENGKAAILSLTDNDGLWVEIKDLRKIKD